MLGASSTSLSCGKRGVLRVFFNVVVTEAVTFCVRTSLDAEAEFDDGFLLMVPEGRLSLEDRPSVLILGAFFDPPGTRALGLEAGNGVAPEAEGLLLEFTWLKLSRCGIVGEKGPSSGTSLRLRTLLMFPAMMARECAWSYVVS